MTPSLTARDASADGRGRAVKLALALALAEVLALPLPVVPVTGPVWPASLPALPRPASGLNGGRRHGIPARHATCSRLDQPTSRKGMLGPRGVADIIITASQCSRLQEESKPVCC